MTHLWDGLSTGGSLDFRQQLGVGTQVDLLVPEPRLIQLRLGLRRHAGQE